MNIKIVIIILFSSCLFAQQNQIKDLSLGNKWFYHYYIDPQGNPPAERVVTFMVIDDTLISNVEFKKTEIRLKEFNGDIIAYQFEQADSFKLRTIYQCHFWNGDPWTDEISYDFSLEVGDTFYNQPLDPGYYPMFVVDYKGDTLIFNEQLNYINITTVECRYSAIPFNEIFVTEKFGAVKIVEHGSDYIAIKTLKGALIDGIVYGDTIVVSVEEDIIKPEVYSLSQNHPNPFNPSTTIKFEISDRSFVTIKVYDVLGKEVATLVNEEKPAGSYEVKFDGTVLPTGIYFYQLKAGNYFETRKMVLLK
jgi:hypothetical protein